VCLLPSLTAGTAKAQSLVLDMVRDACRSDTQGKPILSRGVEVVNVKH